MRKRTAPRTAPARHVVTVASALAVATLALGSCGDVARRSPQAKELRILRLEEPLPESPQIGLLAQADVTHYALVRRILALTSAPAVSALWLQVGAMGGSWGRAQDLSDALAAVRRAGKPVHCHFEAVDNLGYALLARSCDRISMSPGGALDLVGVSADLVYARELLASVGLDAELIQMGKYKGAADMFTRDAMPAETKQTMDAILDDLQSDLLAAVSAGRKLPRERVQQLIDSGPFTAEQARSAGLVDDVSFDDEARQHAKQAAKAERLVEEELFHEREFSLRDLFQAFSGGEREQRPEGKRLVLAYLDGTIMRGEARSTRSSHAEPFVQAMREFADDAEVKAVVLRIDSPGGSALASDLMWHAVRRVAKRKPVIVSLGDLAASGGYYVASAGSLIVAQDQSLVGSIGVVGGKIVVQDLAQRVGVHVEQLARGRHADWASPVRKWSPDERAAFETALRETYERFLARVAEGRGRPRAQIEPLAEGRLMTAQRARAGGLVDREGGINTAISLARQRSGLGGAAPIEVWPEQSGLLASLRELVADGSEGRTLGARVLAGALGTLSHTGIVELLLAGDRMHAATVLPYALSIH